MSTKPPAKFDESAPPAARPREHFTVKEFAERSGFGVATIRRYLASGRLPKYQPGGARCRVAIPASALESMAGDAAQESSDHETSAADAARSPSSSASVKTKALSGPRPRWRQNK